jgi:hypothetical protein
MNCPFCKSDIEQDSFFCDQCGNELFICPQCKNLAKGKRCTQDGSKLVSLKEFKGASKPAAIVENKPEAQTIPTPEVKPVNVEPQVKPVQVFPTASEQRKMKLINHSLNINIELENGDIIGRKAGKFSTQFGKLNQISGKHAQVIYDQVKGWCIIDLGSSNGTKYNGVPLSPSVPQKIENQTKVILANIEFIILFDEPADDDRTVRI